MQDFKGLQQSTVEMSSAENRNLMGDWAELCPDLLNLIAKRIHQYEDFVAFGGVCRSWRCVAVKENFDLSVQIPWLMLSKEEVVGSHQRFVSLSKGGMVRRVFLPEARGKDLHSSMGWLISTDQYNNMELLHPLTRRQIPLPCLVSCRLPLNQAVLSASPSFTDDYAVMVIIASQLYFWKPGNKVWKMVGLSSCRWYNNVIYYKDKFYAIDTNLSLFLCDNNSGNTHAVGHVSPSMQLAFAEAAAAYLVKSANELLLVLWGRHRGYPTVKVYKYCDSSDMMNNNWQKINNLGGESIFVGSFVATAVPVNAATEIKPNCIYFSWYMEIYNLESRTIEPMPEVISPCSSSTWVIPSF